MGYTPHNLQNRTAIITGASKGIGAACATHLAKEGVNLVLLARDEKALLSLAEELQTEYQVTVDIEVVDMQSRQQVERAYVSIAAKHPQIDILINNAGLARGLEPLHEGSVDDWVEMIDTNIKGVLYLTRAVLPKMVAEKSGDIVMIGSIAGHQVYPGGNVYCATKHAVNALARAIKKDVDGTRVRVISIDPGAVETNFSVTRFHGNTARAKKVYENMEPLTADDLARIIVFCLSQPRHININQLVITATDQASML